MKFTVEWATNTIWGHTASRFFKGRQAGNKARGWCNYMLNNPPYYFHTFYEEKTK